MAKDLVLFIATALVDSPSEVIVNEIDGEHSTILELQVNPADLGKVIGRHGRIAKAIRTLLNVAGTKTGQKLHLEILDQ